MKYGIILQQQKRLIIVRKVVDNLLSSLDAKILIDLLIYNMFTS